MANVEIMQRPDILGAQIQYRGTTIVDCLIEVCFTVFECSKWHEGLMTYYA